MGVSRAGGRMLTSADVAPAPAPPPCETLELRRVAGKTSDSERREAATSLRLEVAEEMEEMEEMELLDLSDAVSPLSRRLEAAESRERMETESICSSSFCRCSGSISMRR